VVGSVAPLSSAIVMRVGILSYVELFLLASFVAPAEA
jgi:hypothetical protein